MDGDRVEYSPRRSDKTWKSCGAPFGKPRSRQPGACFQGGLRRPAKAPHSVHTLRGIVPPLPGHDSIDFDDQIAAAMESSAAHIDGTGKHQPL